MSPFQVIVLLHLLTLLGLLVCVYFTMKTDRILQQYESSRREARPVRDAVPYCFRHYAVASRQQVKGGKYMWMDYCNYYLRSECEMGKKWHNLEGAQV